MAEWLVRESHILYVAVCRRSNPKLSRFFFLLIRGLFLPFIAFYGADFCRYLASVCEAQLRSWVILVNAIKIQSSEQTVVNYRIISY